MCSLFNIFSFFQLAKRKQFQQQTNKHREPRTKMKRMRVFGCCCCNNNNKKKRYPEKGQVLNIQWNRLEEVCMFYCMSFTCFRVVDCCNKKSMKFITELRLFFYIIKIEG